MLAVAVIVLGAGAMGLRRWQRERQVQVALAEGKKAYQAGNWNEAARQLGRFVARRLNRLDDPQVVEVCKQYADAQLKIEPLEASNIQQAAATYRRLLRDGEFDPDLCDRLARIYQTTSDAAELEHLAELFQKHDANDPRWRIWLAQAYAAQRDPEAAKKELTDVVAALEQSKENNDAYVKACLMLASLPSPSEDAWVKGWLDRAIAYDPASSEALAIRARYYRFQAERDDTVEGQRDAFLESAREDLAQAESIQDATPAARLLLCAELRAHGALDRADAQVAAAAAMPDDVVRETYLDLTDWRIDVALEQIANAVARNEPQVAAAKAQAVLADLKDPAHRVRVLPIDVELAAAAGDLDHARQSLNEYLDATPADRPQTEPTRAYLSALVADAEHDPYAVVNLLDPLREDVRFNGRMRSLLADAYRATGQSGRVSVLYESTPSSSAATLSSSLVAVQAMIERGEAAGAQRETQRLLRRYPDNVGLQLLRISADLAMARRDRPDAAKQVRAKCEADLQTLIQQHPDNLDARVRLASLLMETNRAPEAEQVFAQAARDCQDSPDTMLYLASYYNAEHKSKEAESTLRDAVARWPDRSEPLIALGRHFAQAGDDATAIQEVSQGLPRINVDGKADVVRWLAAVEVRQDSTHDDGIARLKALVAGDPNEILGRLMLLQLPEVRNDADAAEQLIGEIRSTEGDAGLRWRLARARYEIDTSLAAGGASLANNPQPIESLLKACVDGDPTWASPVLEIGRYYEALQHPAQAEQAYRRSLDARPQTPVAERLFALLRRENRLDDAATLIDRYPQLFRDPRHDDWRLSIAAATGDTKRVSEVIEQRYADDADNPDTLLLYALKTYADTRDVDQSLEYVERARRVGADPVAAARTQAKILNSEGRVDDARAVLDDLIRDTDTADARALRATYLDSLGDTTAAEADYRKLIELDTSPRGHALLCEFYAKRNRLSDAIAVAEAGLNQYPDALLLKRGLLKALLVRRDVGDLDRAATLLDTVPDKSRDTDMLWIEALLARARGGADVAEHLQNILDRAALDPHASVETFRGLITVALDLQRFDVARSLLRAASDQHGASNVDLLAAQARIAIRAENAVVALAALRDAVETAPPNAEIAELLLAVAPLVQDRSALRPFLAPLNDAVDNDPTSEPLVLARAGLLQMLDEPDDAIAALNEYIKRPGVAESGPALLALASLHQDKGDFAAAGELIDRAAAQMGDSPNVRRARVQWLESQKQYDALRTFTADLIARGPLDSAEDKVIALGAAQALADSRQPAHVAEAVDLFKALIEAAPQFVPARMALALAYVNQQRLDEAIGIYRGVLDIDPDTHVALNNLAWLLATHQQNYEEARAFAERAVQLQPDNRDYHDTLAEIYMTLPESLEQARAEYQTCADLSENGSPAQARAYLKLAAVYIRMERFDDAARFVSLCRQIDGRRGGSVLTEAERAELDTMDLTIQDH